MEKIHFDQDYLEKIRRELIRKQETIAVAESVTGGLLQTAFTQAECAAEFFQGGITAYNLGQKAKHFQVDPIHALKCNCVSEKVAVAMALQVCKLFNSQWVLELQDMQHQFRNLSRRFLPIMPLHTTVRLLQKER